MDQPDQPGLPCCSTYNVRGVRVAGVGKAQEPGRCVRRSTWLGFSWSSKFRFSFISDLLSGSVVVINKHYKVPGPDSAVRQRRVCSSEARYEILSGRNYI